MSIFKIEGGHKLNGEITPQGAKNEALQVISAVLLSASEIVISNIPNINDVNRLIDLLIVLGVKVKKLSSGVYSFKADKLNTEIQFTEEFMQMSSKLRGSIMIAGPMLARLGNAVVYKPGGDKIGRRRLDTHFFGFKKLGADFKYIKEKSLFEIKTKELKGNYMLLDEASVTGTANIVMAAVLAKGTTQIYNAASEPYVQQLCRMLNNMGAKITGIGSNLLIINGVAELGGTKHRLLPDMIEIGSFIGLAAMTQSAITIKNVSYKDLGLTLLPFERLGVKMEIKGDDIFIPEQKVYQIESFVDGSIMTISDAPWPGISPDLLSVVLVTATQARGSVLIHQKMFESRLFFVDKLIDMGAQIILCDPHRATVIGLERKFMLKSTRMSSPDIRAGVALLIAALSASGTSYISNIEQIDRGYESIDTRLRRLGAHIERIDN
ncbi:MAG: UDP-N-acetylglucosamine 1-carboxyvinyltransferase [Bacteroidales bacterium]|nr:UDP-N-acetylglucosamine 1-carboxyvinyltransferase [Bacteroidales bacterium]